MAYIRRFQIVEIAEVFDRPCSGLYVERHSRRRPACPVAMLPAQRVRVEGERRDKKLKRSFANVVVSLLYALTLVTCGGGASTGGTLNVGTLGEQLAFNPATLPTVANAPTTVTFKNNSTSQQHNWVLVRGGDDLASQVDEAGLAAGPGKGYIPDDTSKIIAHTNLLNAGQSGSVSFTAPAAGTYTYLCTVPGHYTAGMKGTLTVQ